jgi:hypothetical protein
MNRNYRANGSENARRRSGKPLALRPLNGLIDEIIIINCLPEPERRRTNLGNSLTALLRGIPINHYEIDGSTSKLFSSALDCALHRSVENRIVLHVISHGTKLGLFLKSTGTLIPWHSMTEKLAAINRNMGGDLLIVMNACEGLHAININHNDFPDIAFGVIGPNVPIWSNQLQVFNRMFYRALEQGQEIGNLIQSLRQATRMPFFAFTSEGWHTYRGWVLQRGITTKTLRRALRRLRNERRRGN